MQFDIYYSYVLDCWKWAIIDMANGKALITCKREYSTSTAAAKAARRFVTKMRGPTTIIFNTIPRGGINALRKARSSQNS